MQASSAQQKSAPTTAAEAAARRLFHLALWTVPGVGVRGIQKVEAAVYRDFQGALSVRPDVLLSGFPLTDEVRAKVASYRTLRDLAEETQEACLRGRMEAVFPGDAAYPENLTSLSDPHAAPPLLFFRGTVGAIRRRVAMVGSRTIPGKVREWTRDLAREVAQSGIGVVSGAARGVDMLCHEGALAGGGETWAFLGSALDQIDSAQRNVCGRIVAAGGALYSELPPGVRADPTKFPRRNRLIAGAADAVWLVRSKEPSGSRYTVDYGVLYGRPICVVPVGPKEECSEGNVRLLREGAVPCFSVGDLCRVLRVPERPHSPAPTVDEVMPELSAQAQRALCVLKKVPTVFEELVPLAKMPENELIAALSELEILGLARKHPGKRYEKV